MKSQKWINSLNLIGSIAVLLVISGFGSCSPSIGEICTLRIPELDEKLNDALLALSPWTPGSPGVPNAARGIASEGGDLPPVTKFQELAGSDRLSWTHWAEGHLITAQRFHDAVLGEDQAKPLQQALTEISNHLVTFHAYAQTGRVERMVATIHKIQAQVARARGLACVNQRM